MPEKTSRRGGLTNLQRREWVLEQVVAGWVHRDDDYHYRVQGYTPGKPGRGLDDTCTAMVERLADEGCVVEHRDGTVTVTAKGEAEHAGYLRGQQIAATRLNPFQAAAQ